MSVTVETFSTLAETTTTADPGAAGALLDVTSRTLFPQRGQFRVLVQDSETDKTNREIMLVTAGFGSGAGSFTVTRGMAGTAGVAHPVGSYVAQTLTADALERWLPEYSYQPRLDKLALAPSLPPHVFGAGFGATAPTASRFNFVKCWTPEPITIANFNANVAAAGTTWVGHCGVYTVPADGTVATLIASNTSATAVAAGKMTRALTAVAGQSLSIPGGPGSFALIGWLTISGTAGTFSRMSSGESTFVNGALTAADGWQYGNNGANVVALPATIALASCSISGLTYQFYCN